MKKWQLFCKSLENEDIFQSRIARSFLVLLPASSRAKVMFEVCPRGVCVILLLPYQTATVANTPCPFVVGCHAAYTSGRLMCTMGIQVGISLVPK